MFVMESSRFRCNPLTSVVTSQQAVVRIFVE